MNIVLPMAGRGSRLKDQGYATPKPLIEINLKPMFVHALSSLGNLKFDRIIIVALREHEEQYSISNLIKKFLNPNKTKLLLIDEVTDGQLCTVLAAKKYINKKPLLVLAADTFILSDLEKDIENTTNSEGLIQLINLPGDQWSFASLGKEKIIISVAEKRISDWASTGIYYFKNGLDFIAYAQKTIKNNITKNGEYYIMPLYQLMINDKKNIRGIFAKRFFDMGSKSGIEKFTEYLVG